MLMSRLSPQGTHPITQRRAIGFGAFEARRAQTEFAAGIDAACVS
jgi:hypothetical protein